MKVKKLKFVELIIAIVITGFWVFMILFGVINQFNISSIDSSDFYNFLEKEKPLILDLRESSEILSNPLDYEKTIHLPFLFIESRLNQINIPQNGPVLTVCSDGNRARLITTLLDKKGVNSYYLKSGLDGVERGE